MMKIILVVSLILSLAVLEQVNGQCYDLIKQYYECKYLRMNKQNNSWGEIDYRPVKSRNHRHPNKLDDKFYRRQGLAKLDFDEGMRLFRKIYDETENCHSKFCKCVSFKHIDYYNNYSIWFRNETNYKQVKRIISAFNEKFESKKLSFHDVFNPIIYSARPIEPYPFFEPQLKTINKFCYRNDYSWARMNYYNFTVSCYNFNYSYMAFYDCEWSTNVVNKTLSLNYTDSQREQLFVCNLLNYAGRENENGNKCAKESIRYQAMLTWISSFPDLKWSGKSLAAYLDRLIEQAKEYTPTIDFRSADFYSYDNTIYTHTFNDTWQVYETNDTSFVRSLIDSDELKIDAEWRYNSSGGVNNLAGINITFIDENDNNRKVNLTIDVTSWPDLDKTIGNETLFKDSKDENWVQVFWYKSEYWASMEIYDFQTNSHIYVYRDSLTLNSPLDLFESASGTFVEGLNNTRTDNGGGLIQNREYNRNYDDRAGCESRCDRLTNSRLVSETLRRANPAYKVCLDQCSKAF